MSLSHYGLGMDAPVIVRRMHWKRMLLWFGHGCSRTRMRSNMDFIEVCVFLQRRQKASSAMPLLAVWPGQRKRRCTPHFAAKVAKPCTSEPICCKVFVQTAENHQNHEVIKPLSDSKCLQGPTFYSTFCLLRKC